MRNDFDQRIKQIELELLALKTSSLYTSIRNAARAYSGLVTTGLYRIDYEETSENIISEIYSDKYKQTSGGIYPRTPEGSSQIVEVNTTFASPDTNGGYSPQTFEISLVVISNVPVNSITKIS